VLELVGLLGAGPTSRTSVKRATLLLRSRVLRLLVRRILPAIVAAHVQGADPHRARNRLATARRLLRRVIRQQRRVGVELRQVELLDRVLRNDQHSAESRRSPTRRPCWPFPRSLPPRDRRTGTCDRSIGERVLTQGANTRLRGRVEARETPAPRLRVERVLSRRAGVHEDEPADRGWMRVTGARESQMFARMCANAARIRSTSGD
jgi:hypothetical protein